DRPSPHQGQKACPGWMKNRRCPVVRSGSTSANGQLVYGTMMPSPRTQQRGKPMPPVPPDPFAAKRAAMCEEFLDRHFLLGGWLGGTDTYKRTMWAAVPDVALARAGYALTMRRGLSEPGAGPQLIMAGHEAMLAQWFRQPLK